jgi:hypothetical protein
MTENALPMFWTKLDLESRPRQEELNKLAESFKGLRLVAPLLGEGGLTRRRVEVPQHIDKSPEDIVKDYLQRLVQWWKQDQDEKIGLALLQTITVDVVVTHPAVGLSPC